MKLKVRISALLVAVPMLLSSLAGCSSQPNTPAASEPAPAPAVSQSTPAPAQTASQPEAVAPADGSIPSEPYELNVAWWGGEGRHTKTLEMIDNYMKENPQVKVTAQYAAYTDYWTKRSTEAAAGNMPDVYLVQLSYIGEYASKGLMRPLQDLVDAGKIDVSKYTPGALSSSSYNGELVGITMGDTSSCLIYNKTILDKAGYPLPTDQMTYSEFAAYIKGLVPLLPADTYAMQMAGHNEFTYENYFRQLGDPGLLTADGKALGYTKEHLTDFFSYHLDLFNANANGTMDVILDDRTKQFADSLYGKGKEAIYWNNINQTKIYQASLDDEMGMVRFPIADNATNKYVEAAVPSTWAIYAKSQKVDEAAHFIDFMVNNWDEAQKIYDMDIGVPGSTVIQQNLIDGLDTTDKVAAMKKKEIELMQDILNTIEPFPGRPSNFPVVVDDLYNKMDAVLAGQMTPEQATDAHFSQMQLMLQ